MSFEHDPEARGIHEFGTQSDLDASAAWAEKRGYPVERSEPPAAPEPAPEPVVEAASEPEPEPVESEAPAPAPRSADPLSPRDHWAIRAANRQAAEARMAQERAAAEAAQAAAQQAQPQAQDEGEAPDPVLEPDKYWDWRFKRSDYARRLEQAEYQARALAMTIAGQQQVQRMNLERQQEVALVAQVEEAYARENPSYYADVDAWFNRTKQGFIDGMGMNEFQADATAKAEAARYLDLARRTGRDPAVLMHSLCRGMGGATAPAPQPRQNPARVAKAQAHAAGGVGVSTSPQPLNPAAMAARGMTRDELIRIKREMGPKAGVRAAIAALDFINAQG